MCIYRHTSMAGHVSAPRKRPAPWSSRGIGSFERLEQIGEGVYGQVYKARDTRDGSLVALKKIKMDIDKEGFPITAMREIKLLLALRHRNIVDLREIVTSSRGGARDDDRGSGCDDDAKRARAPGIGGGAEALTRCGSVYMVNLLPRSSRLSLFIPVSLATRG